jgi:hypothetical protein
MTHVLKKEIFQYDEKEYILYRVGNNDINNKITVKRSSELMTALITITLDDGNTTCKMKLNNLIEILENINNSFYDTFNINNKIINYIKNNNNLLFKLLYPYKCTGYDIVNEFSHLKTISDDDKNSVIIFTDDNDEINRMILQKYIDAKYNYRFNFLHKY